LQTGFPLTEQRACGEARAAFFERLELLAQQEPDLPASAALIPGDRWNALIRTTMGIIVGGELEEMSARDFDNYADTETNWRVAEGFGTVIAAHAAGVPVALGCPVTRIDHTGKRIRLETARGVIEAGQVIVTLPTSVLVAMEDLFFPALPGKIDAARGLPLGLDDKLYLALERADEFERDSRVFGRTDRLTGAYHMRPSGLPMIEAYFGGKLAGDLERGGATAFFDFAASELSALFGADFARRLKPLGVHAWGTDPYARGAYSFARPGYADCRQVLAAPVDGRLFFAGEACSKHDFSTAHGALLTGIDAAQQLMAQ
jgi:monoamine oxidase